MISGIKNCVTLQNTDRVSALLDFISNQTSSVYSEQLSQMVKEAEIRSPGAGFPKIGLKAVEWSLGKPRSGDLAGKKLVIDMQASSDR